MSDAASLEPLDVFLSHHSANKPWVRNMRDKLVRLGLIVRLDMGCLPWSWLPCAISAGRSGRSPPECVSSPRERVLRRQWPVSPAGRGDRIDSQTVATVSILLPQGTTAYCIGDVSDPATAE